MIPEWVGRGLGVPILWARMLKTRHRLPDAKTYFAAPDHRNAASLRVLDKLGFTRGVWFGRAAGGRLGGHGGGLHPRRRPRPGLTGAGRGP
ncbi:hypothetical protein [Nocardioides sp. B-3]|uniref:hypothetical protein n=1 Tax=Nocardioides sp. B-3 TaxID=2895565 RepID=UPI002152D027|nr:hypothetical protein [Nocardioides sp. B-3]UUZ59300.1 hypothetical protein LP418_26165 [Nocardioides sp. B-3]